jgi:hypothetical protein
LFDDVLSPFTPRSLQFDNTRVLMTQLTERSVVGLILNKTFTDARGTLFVGGPCELDLVTVRTCRHALSDTYVHTLISEGSCRHTH